MSAPAKWKGNARGVRRHLPTLLWFLLVAVLLLLPGEDLPDQEMLSWADKPVHALLFAVQCALLARSLSPPRARWRIAAAAIPTAVLAVVLEVAQLWIPGRTWEWMDLAAGLLGIALVPLLAARHRARLPGAF